MNEAGKQTIETAGELSGLLGNLGDLLFKGLSGILDRATEYQEEYGVLKQVSHIRIVGNDSGNEYDLTIKLSPVKDREDIFYVEANTDAPGLDVTSINKKAIKLNKNTSDKFDEMITKLLNDHNMKVAEEVDDDSDESEDNNHSTLTEDQVKQLDRILDDVQDEIDSLDRRVYINDADDSADDSSSSWTLAVDIYHEDANDYISVELNIIRDLSTLDDAKYKETKDLIILNDDNQLISQTELLSDIKQLASDYTQAKHIDHDDDGIFASSVIVKATFVKCSETNQVELRAINAVSNFEQAVNAIYDITSSTDFTDLLTNEPQSFEITDLGDGYDVNPIGGFETCCVIRKFV